MYEGTMAQIVEGEIVKSKVLRVTENAVILDVGFKSEGSVPLDEFKDPQSLKEGDEVVAGTVVGKVGSSGRSPLHSSASGRLISWQS